MLARMLLHLLVLYGVVHQVVAQNQTFLNILVSALNAQELTNFTSIFKQAQSDSSQLQLYLALSDASTNQTLFVPNNDACTYPPYEQSSEVTDC